MKAVVSVVLALLCVSSVSVPAQAPVAKPPVTTTESPDIQELQKVENKWSDALNQRDQYALELVLSPLFVDVAATGDISTRNQAVVALINQADKTAVTDQHVITVRMLGDVAVANGTYSFTHKGNSGEAVERGVFTHVFQRSHGNWICLNAQRTAVRDDAPGKGKAARTKSKAEEPFHIPLFSKGDKNSSNQ